jgi:hypothetical protein
MAIMAFARPCLAALLLIWLSLGDAQGAPKPVQPLPSKEGLEFFEKKIRPILVHNCYECHSGDPAKAKAHLVLDNHDGLRKGGDSGAAVVPGHADTSLLIEAIRYEGLEMPPKGQLPDEVIEDFVQWIAMGAPDPRLGKAAKPANKVELAEARKFWAFRRPKTSPAPPVVNTSWPKTDIDRFILARQEKEHLRTSADADAVTLIRRVTFDLIGLPPTPEQIDAFVRDTSGTALPKVVDQLLASTQFGERWGRHWLDVVRYAESNGKGRNIPFRYAWRYRDYVIDSFNADKPFDRFIIEQLAGDLLHPKNAADRDTCIIATGFLALGPKPVNTRNPEQFKMDLIDDQIDVTSRAMLGMTVACARCHDHKFDPIPQADYYALAGIFHSTETLAGVAPGKKTAVENLLVALTTADKRFELSVEQQREQKAHRLEITQVEAQLEKLRALQKQVQNKPKAPKQGKGRKRTPGPVSKNPYVNLKQIREDIKKLEDRLDELESVETPPDNLAMGVREARSPSNCNVLLRGELKDKGPEVQRGVLTILKTPQSAHIDPRRSGRAELAGWIASKDNPLTARVMVNRVWEHLFGQGLVDTVDNFGAMGNEPSHPELLDTLAVQFVNGKWSVKKLIRSIVLSRVYQLSSQHDAKNYEIDPANRFLWRMERRRLDAEEIRDAILVASGQLDRARPDGSPVMELGNMPTGGNKKLQEIRNQSNLRSVYLPILRGLVPEMLQVFDEADPGLIVGKRDVTTVPTQALFLMNNPFVLRQAGSMAKRILEQKDLNQQARIEMAFRLALGRPATEQERTEVAKHLNEYRQTVQQSGQKANPLLAAWTSVCQTLFQCGEFRYVY